MKGNCNIIYMMLAMLIVTMSACEEDYFGKNRVEDGVGVKMQITASTQFSGVESRAVYESGDNFTESDVQIDNYCFLLFNPSKKLIRAFDLSPSDLPFYIYLPVPTHKAPEPHTAYLLGNVSLNDLFEGDLNAGKYSYKLDDKNVVAETMAELYGLVSIDDLKNKFSTITRQYNKPTEGQKNKFTWSGYLSVTAETKMLNFKLNPNVAKLTATIKNESTSGSKLMSVRLKNVVDKVAFAQNALNKSNNSSADRNDVSSINYLKYDMEYLEIAQNQSQTISWYVPQNKQGSGDRENNAPDNATYLEIDGVKMPNYITSAYRVYPGANPDNKDYAELTDFNISADTIYNMTVIIKDDGIYTEVSNGVTGYKPAIDLATGKVKLPPNSNCYMIHPIGDRIVDEDGNYATVYELPIDRVNQYWKDVVKTDASRILDANSEWTVEVIWQDINTRVLDFCDEYGGNKADIYNGNGLNPFCFKLRNDATVSDNQTYGNVLVGLKKAGVDGYLWSWHLWITDYNPDVAPSWSESSNKLYATNSTSGRKIDLQGCKYGNRSNDNNANFTTNTAPNYNTSRSYDGNVQHYHSQYSGYWTSYTVSSDLWDRGIYKNKWIMDRNLGAMSSNSGDIAESLDGWGMYYQFGRKDPFSYKYLYKIDGTTRIYPSKGLGAQWDYQTQTNPPSVEISESVKNPKKFFNVNGEWANDATDYDWYSPTTPKFKGAKTLFDPCPPGWCVPLCDIMSFANQDLAHQLETLYLGKNSSGNETWFVEDNSIDILNKFVSDISNYSSPHAAINVYADVKGTYNSSTDYDNRKDDSYNRTLTSYYDRHRLFAVLNSTRDNMSLKSMYPLQGIINGSTGIIEKMISDNLSPVQEAKTSGKVWGDYNCWTAQGCMWSAEKGAGTSGRLMQIFTTTYGNWVNARQERRCGRLYLRFYGTLNLKNYLTSRGQNVRCIQEPD